MWTLDTALSAHSNRRNGLSVEKEEVPAMYATLTPAKRWQHVVCFAIFSVFAARADAVLFDVSIGGFGATFGFQNILMPFSSDPSNALGDSEDGFGFVTSDVIVSSLGIAAQLQVSGRERCIGSGDNECSGEPFEVSGLGRADLKLILRDIDGRDGRSYAIPPQQAFRPPTGDNLELFLDVFFDLDYEATYDPANPLTSLFPGAVYSSLFDITVPVSQIRVNGSDTVQLAGCLLPPGISCVLDNDLNTNGLEEIVQFLAGDILVGFGGAIATDESSLVYTQASVLLNGSIKDLGTDPPFVIGPGVVSNPVRATFTRVDTPSGQAVPEPGTFALFAFTLIGLGIAVRRAPSALIGAT